jgi:hypothetical protein
MKKLIAVASDVGWIRNFLFVPIKSNLRYHFRPLNLPSYHLQSLKIRSSADRRVQHIRVRGSPAEALAAMNDMDGK